MKESKVRQRLANHEAGTGEDELVCPVKRFFGRRNTIGDICYVSNSHLATGDEDACAYKTCPGRDQQSGLHRQSCGNHFENFIGCVRTRKKENLNAPIEDGVISTAFVHLANASYRLGRSLRSAPETQQVVMDDEAKMLLRDGSRRYRAPFKVSEEI